MHLFNDRRKILLRGDEPLHMLFRELDLLRGGLRFCAGRKARKCSRKEGRDGKTNRVVHGIDPRLSRLICYRRGVTEVGPKEDTTSVVVRKSASFLPLVSSSGFPNHHTRLIGFASVLRIRSPLTSKPQNEADFGFGTLVEPPENIAKCPRFGLANTDLASR